MREGSCQWVKYCLNLCGLVMPRQPQKLTYSHALHCSFCCSFRRRRVLFSGSRCSRRGAACRVAAAVAHCSDFVCNIRRAFATRVSAPAKANVTINGIEVSTCKTYLNKSRHRSTIWSWARRRSLRSPASRSRRGASGSSDATVGSIRTCVSNVSSLLQICTKRPWNVHTF